eukprot:TRINITY_DN36812_c0_g1_i1.p1 TRINITY_DN36812_c0_g1~~TRINITY_DN36812_c0_g1_i1.p1  ORF type:complete len:142 (-),score=11.88 TRINITY_DN36812_c0_g1_i1:760-1185(-)
MNLQARVTWPHDPLNFYTRCPEKKVSYMNSRIIQSDGFSIYGVTHEANGPNHQKLNPSTSIHLPLSAKFGKSNHPFSILGPHNLHNSLPLKSLPSCSDFIKIEKNLQPIPTLHLIYQTSPTPHALPSISIIINSSPHQKQM